MDAKIQQMFDDAKHIVFLTGAGVSTPSGIPDYRSKNGLYTKDKSSKPAEYFLSHPCLVNQPKVFYRFVKKNMYYPKAKPNAIHLKQAQLTREGRASIVTQNVDNLYRAAHAKHLVEFHGNLYRVYCTKCGKTVNWRTYLKNPVHQTDGGTLRPDIVLYGEGLKRSNIIRSIQMMEASDLVVIVGTSMRVYPFAGLLQYHRPGVPVIAVNQERLNLGVPIKMVQGDAVKFFRELKV